MKERSGRTCRRVVGAVAGTVVLTTGLLAGTAAPANAYATAACDPVSGVTPADNALAIRLSGQLHAGLRTTLTGYRISCARMVIGTVQARGLGQQAAVAAITATIVESGLQNIAQQVDHDSLGLFQQRATWGPAASRLDVRWATNAFLNKMLGTYPNGSWATAAVGVVCQRVQVSAYPDRYQVQVADAGVIVGALWSGIADRGLLAADVTGDGRAELIGRRPEGSLWMFTNVGGRRAPYAPAAQIGTGWQQFLWLVAGDVTGDGRADLLAALPDGGLWLYAHTSSATLPYAAGVRVGTGWQQFTRVAVGDVTGDGHADLLAVRPDGTLWLYQGSGVAAAPFVQGRQIGFGWQNFTHILAGDVSGKGRADLLAVLPDGTLWRYANSGDNSAPFGSGTQIGIGWQGFSSIQLAPVTADRRADLVAERPDGTQWLYPNSHNNAAPYTTGAQIGVGWQVFA